VRDILLIGVVTSAQIGAPKDHGVVFEHIELVERRGTSVRLENVRAIKQVANLLEVDSVGRFYFREDGRANHLLAIERADGVEAFDLHRVSIDDLKSFIEGP